MRLPIALALVAGLSSPAHAMGLVPHVIHFPADGLLRTAGFAFGCLFAVMLYFVATDWPRDASTMASKIAMGAMVTLLVLCTTGAFALDSDGTEPDPVLTPGAVRTVRRDEIVGVNTATVRNVTGAEKLAVYRRYGMTGPHDTIPGTSHQAPFEIDHRVPLCAGGANDITNLWVEASDGPWTFHDKDALEDRTCAKLKKGLVTVEQAQAVFLGDWKAGYVAEFGGAPR